MAIAMVVVLGSIMTVLDMTIVNVALNRLSEDLHAPMATIQWVATGYTLALATAIPITPWVVGRFGAKRAYLISIAVFTVGSVLAGLAWDIGSLIGFRVVQGLGGGMITPVGMTVIIRAAERARMGRAMSVLGIPVLIGPLAGPILGGWLTDSFSWRWIFFINIPLGALALVLAARTFGRDVPLPGIRLDVAGLLMLSPGLASVLFGLAGVAEGDGFGSLRVLAPVVAGAILILAFVARALTTARPLIDLRLAARRPIATAAAMLALFTCAYFGSLLLLPLYFQLVRDQSATATGLLGIPQVLATGITMQIASRMIDKRPPGRLIPAGVALAGAGYLTFTTQLGAATPYWILITALTVAGVGVGMTIMPAMTAATRDIPDAEVPTATAALNIVQQVASAAGTALMSVLLTTSMAGRLPAATGGDLDAIRALSTETKQQLAPSLADAFQHTYGWATALMAAALLPALLIPATRGQAGPANAGHGEPARQRRKADPR